MSIPSSRKDIARFAQKFSPSHESLQWSGETDVEDDDRVGGKTIEDEPLELDEEPDFVKDEWAEVKNKAVGVEWFDIEIPTKGPQSDEVFGACLVWEAGDCL